MGLSAIPRHRNRFRTLTVSCGLAAVTLLAGCSSTSNGAAPSRSALTRDFQVRPVLSVAPTGSAGCASATKDAAATSPVTACSTDGKTTYSLGPAGVTADQVTSWKTYNSLASGGGKVEVGLNSAGQAGLTALTTSLATKAAPQSEMAVYEDGRVQSAPTVMAAITSATFTIQ